MSLLAYKYGLYCVDMANSLNLPSYQSDQQCKMAVSLFISSDQATGLPVTIALRRYC